MTELIYELYNTAYCNEAHLLKEFIRITEQEKEYELFKSTIVKKEHEIK